MSFRFGAVVLFALAFVLGGCASGGTGSTEAGDGAGANVEPTDMSEMEEEDLPEWVQELPEGTSPSDNQQTNQATLYMVQAQGADEEGAEELYQQALQQAEASIAAEPENPQGYFMAGQVHFELGNYEEAAEWFDQAEEIYPRYVLETEFYREQAWVDLFNEGVEISDAQDDPMAALPYYERAHAIYQGRPEAMLNLGDLYAQQERWDESAEVYGQAIEVMTGPRVDEVDEELRASYDEFLRIAHFNRAQALFQLERYAEAAEEYEAILEGDPENLQAISNLAVSLVAAGETARAQEIYDDLLNRPGLGPAEYIQIGVGLYQAEAYEQAARAFNEVWQLIPNHRDAAFHYAQNLYLAEAWEELVTATDDLVELDPQNELAYRFRAQALNQLEREEELEQTLTEMDALEFLIVDLQFQNVQGGAVVDGFVVNKDREPGSTVNVEWEFYDPDGNVVGTTTSELELGEPDEEINFIVEFPTDDQAIGYSYEVL